MPAGHSTAGDPIAPARFTLTVDGVEIATFSDLVAITSEATPDDLAGTLLKKLPGKRKPPTITLRRGMTADLQVDAWHEAGVDGRPSDARKSASLVMFDATGKPVARYHLENAWPAKIEITTIAAGASNVLLETVTLSCDRLQTRRRVTTRADLVDGAEAALQEGRWEDARDAYEAAIGESDSGAARFGLATALWWLGDNRASVEQCTAAYARFRAAGDVPGAVECALWLGVIYKANFANYAAANGWIARAERLLEPIEPGPAHGWAQVTRAYRMADLHAAEELTRQALDLARTKGDIDLELAASSQLGLIRVGQGDAAGGFALIDEAMAAALGGEPSNLGTVVYTACDMLNACELASDAERAAQWCEVADRFVEQYGCPFLYAECRIYYGSVLMATGKWNDAERELIVGVRLTAGTCPGLAPSGRDSAGRPCMSAKADWRRPSSSSVSQQAAPMSRAMWPWRSPHCCWLAVTGPEPAAS